MSFCCNICDEPQVAGTKPQMLLVARRERQYLNTYRQDFKTWTKNSSGWEIVKEKMVCQSCFETQKNK